MTLNPYFIFMCVAIVLASYFGAWRIGYANAENKYQAILVTQERDAAQKLLSKENEDRKAQDDLRMQIIAKDEMIHGLSKAADDAIDSSPSVDNCAPDAGVLRSLNALGTRPMPSRH